jgi:hypothetical protein
MKTNMGDSDGPYKNLMLPELNYELRNTNYEWKQTLAMSVALTKV